MYNIHHIETGVKLQMLPRGAYLLNVLSESSTLEAPKGKLERFDDSFAIREPKFLIQCASDELRTCQSLLLRAEGEQF